VQTVVRVRHDFDCVRHGGCVVGHDQSNQLQGHFPWARCHHSTALDFRRAARLARWLSRNVRRLPTLRLAQRLNQASHFLRRHLRPHLLHQRVERAVLAGDVQGNCVLGCVVMHSSRAAQHLRPRAMHSDQWARHPQYVADVVRAAHAALAQRVEDDWDQRCALVVFAYAKKRDQRYR
jgi:hypothetical protein